MDATVTRSAQNKPAHAELVEVRTAGGGCLDKLGMSGGGFLS